MTSLEFVEAVGRLGIELTPEPHPDHNCQYQCMADPAQQKRASVTREEGLILARLAADKRVLEIGTGLGVSTACLAHGAKRVTTVDTDEWVAANIRMPVNAFIHPSIPINGAYDLAFIDGDHDEESVRRDIVQCLTVVKPGGHIAFHDVSQAQVKAVVDEFPWKTREQFETVGLLTVCEVPE